MLELGVIRDLVAIFGVIAGFSYYVLTVRNNQKNQELQLHAQHQAQETRKLAVYNNYVNNITTKEYITEYLSLMYDQHWETFEEWWENYGPSNPSAYNDFIHMMLWFQNIGMLYEQGVIDIEMLYYDRGWGFTRIWERLEPLISGYRDQMKSKYAFFHAEQLYYALTKFEKTLVNNP